MGVYLPYDDYSAMQGPAPDGFHVPSKDEWVALCGILTSTFGLAQNATTMGTYLKMPKAGYRKNNDAGVGYVGTTGKYWSSSRYSADSAYELDFGSYALSPQGKYYRAYGYSVRCFKDEPISFLDTPLEGWTVLYQGSGNAGIYRNQNRGIISISGDGVTWYTIQDKNLGATAVYNQGDTLIDANCGYFYQWGNNYGFAHSGNVTTSSTRVDASNYGPGNYYNSSTFIMYSGAWDTTDNGNLRGGVTGVKPMSELKNAYIGEYRAPGANTIGYRPFKSDLKDYSGNGHDFTIYTGSVSYVDGMLETNGKLTTTNLMSSLGNNFTMSMYIVANSGTNAECVLSNTSDRNYITLGFGYGFGNYRFVWDNSGWVGPTYTSSLDGNPHLVTATKNGTDVRLYVDGELKTTDTVTKSIVNATYFMLGNVVSYTLVMKFGSLIMENKVRTAQEITDYYNLTKSKYGL